MKRRERLSNWDRRLAAAVAAAAALLFAPQSRAQDVNGVPNADVAPGYASLGLRAGYAPPGGGRPSSFATFVQYQNNLSDRWSVSGGLLFGKRGGDAVAFRALQAGVQWQFAERRRDGADGSLLVQTRLPDGNEGPGRIAALIAGKWALQEDWEVRAAVASSAEFGLKARAGIGIGLRGEATRRLGTFGRAGVQAVDGFNTTAGFGPLKSQSHQAGLVFKKPFGKVQATASALIGLTDAAPQEEFKIFLTYEL